ncbi:hypothetical protein KIH81_04955 [Bifidobacterium sp. 82T25]|nr:hypothetical protein [Bifidobacterium miconisargentati]MBW3090033.1 hypothetical protein [Bifidobacterium miconisargentati]
MRIVFYGRRVRQWRAIIITADGEREVVALQRTILNNLGSRDRYLGGWFVLHCDRARHRVEATIKITIIHIRHMPVSFFIIGDIKIDIASVSIGIMDLRKKVIIPYKQLSRQLRYSNVTVGISGEHVPLRIIVVACTPRMGRFIPAHVIYRLTELKAQLELRAGKRIAVHIHFMKSQSLSRII